MNKSSKILATTSKVLVMIHSTSIKSYVILSGQWNKILTDYLHLKQNLVIVKLRK